MFLFLTRFSLCSLCSSTKLRFRSPLRRRWRPTAAPPCRSKKISKKLNFLSLSPSVFSPLSKSKRQISKSLPNRPDRRKNQRRKKFHSSLFSLCFCSFFLSFRFSTSFLFVCDFVWVWMYACVCIDDCVVWWLFCDVIWFVSCCFFDFCEKKKIRVGLLFVSGGGYCDEFPPLSDFLSLIYKGKNYGWFSELETNWKTRNHGSDLGRKSWR
jgi:hypothetical protein